MSAILLLITVAMPVLALREASLAGEESSIGALYRNHQWFELNTAIRHRSAPELYRGAVFCAFNDIPSCEKHLRRVIGSAPSSETAYEAHRLLEDAYLRTGRYPSARLEAEARLALKPNDHDAQADLTLLQSLPDEQTVRTRAPSKVDYRANYGIPVKINGRGGYYAWDTGAAVSFMSESEAERLGLTVQQSGGHIGNIAGRRVGFKTAVADEITIGHFQIDHVAFLVFPDDRPPFATAPAGHRGVLGIPVLTALETISVHRDGTLEFGASPRSRRLKTANLAFDGQTPITTARIQGKQLTFLVDTGAQETFLYPPFATAFDALIKEVGERESKRITGVDRSSQTEAVQLPALLIRIGKFNVKLQPATVLLTRTTHSSDLFGGNLGIDVLSQADRVTIDFKSMTLLLQ